MVRTLQQKENSCLDSFAEPANCADHSRLELGLEYWLLMGFPRVDSTYLNALALS